MEQGTRIGLGPLDRLVLLGAWLVSCAAVYGLGFYTGNHTQDRLAGEEERVVRLPVTVAPPPVGQRLKSGDDLSFWKALESSGPRIKPGENLPVRPPPVETTADEPDAPPKASAGGQAAPLGKSAKAGQKAGSKTTPKHQKTNPKATATAATGKRPPAKTPAASGKAASKAPQTTAAPASARAPAATKRPATPTAVKPAPRAQSTATASAPKPSSPAATERRAAPPRKAPASPTREARAAAD